jgi:hypothetical protein
MISRLHKSTYATSNILFPPMESIAYYTLWYRARNRCNWKAQPIVERVRFSNEEIESWNRMSEMQNAIS